MHFRNFLKQVMNLGILVYMESFGSALIYCKFCFFMIISVWFIQENVGFAEKPVIFVSPHPFKFQRLLPSIYIYIYIVSEFAIEPCNASLN